MSNLFKNYSKKHVHFYDKNVPALLERGLTLINEVKKPALVDLGCGDGRLLFALHLKGVLNRFTRIVGVDISTERIQRLVSELPFIKGVVSDASKCCLASNSFDFVICSQVIEHVQDDDALVAEIYRLLKDSGVAYISSVIKHRYGVYFYYDSGSFKLDPTHVREYSSSTEFSGLIESRGFKVIAMESSPISYPFVDLSCRLLMKLGFLEPDVSFFRKRRFLSKLRILKVPILGYETVEVLSKKNG